MATVLAFKPKDPLILLQRAMEKADYDRAMPILLELHRDMPEETIFVSDLLYCAEHAKDKDAALETLYAMKAISPEDTGILYCLAVAEANLGLFEDSLENTEESLRISPQNAQGLSLRGSLLAQAGFIRQAMQDLRAASTSGDLPPSSQKNVEHIINSLNQQTLDDKNTLKQLGAALKENPEQPDVLLHYAKIAHDYRQSSDVFKALHQAFACASRNQDIAVKHEIYGLAQQYLMPDLYWQSLDHN